MTRYASAHLAAQFRTHVFSIVLFTKSARLMRWDRAGLIVSEPVSLDKPELAEFFWTFSNANAKDRGYDPTVTPFKFMQDLTKEFLFEQLQFAADPSDMKVEDVNFFEVSLPRTNNRSVIGKATYLAVASLPSRGTRSFKAWFLTTKKPLIFNPVYRTKRPYSDMRLSRLRYSQGGTFLRSDQIVEEDKDENDGENEDEGNEEDDQPPRTRRRLC